MEAGRVRGSCTGTQAALSGGANGVHTPGSEVRHEKDRFEDWECWVAACYILSPDGKHDVAHLWM